MTKRAEMSLLHFLLPALSLFLPLFLAFSALKILEESCFSSFFSCESSSITSTALQSKIGKISFTKSVRQKTAVWNTTMQHFRAFKLQQFHFIIKIALLEWIAFIFTPALSIIKLCAWMLMCTSLNAIRSIVQWRKMSKERWER